MSLSTESQVLRDLFFKTLLEAVFPLESGPDPEVALEALLEATAMLKDRLTQELEQIREAQGD